MRIEPSIVINMNVTQQTFLDRINKKKQDPVTGLHYNLGTQLVKDIEVKDRLVACA